MLQKTTTLALLLASAPGGVAQTTTRVSVGPAGAELTSSSYSPSISEDGRFVAFSTFDSGVVANDTNGEFDVFVRDRLAGTTVRASVSTAGLEGDAYSGFSVLSADGRFVAFSSAATNLAGTDHNGTAHDVFVRDLVAGTTERISVTPSGQGGNDGSWSPDISSDGRFVMFHSYASDLVAGDTPGTPDLFVRDRQTGLTDGVTVGQAGVWESAGVLRSSISGDGRYVAYRTTFAGVITVVIRDRLLGTTVPVVTGATGTDLAESPVLARNASAVVFTSRFNLLPEDERFNQNDLYVYDVLSQQLSLISVGLSGGVANAGGSPSSISADGRYVAFSSKASDLVPNDTNMTFDGFVRDRLTGKTSRVTLGDTGKEGDAGSTLVRFAEGGRSVAFLSQASNLVAADGNGAGDVFVRELCSPASSVTYGAGFPGAGGVVPTLTLSAPPRLGFAPSLQLSNSAGVASPGVLLIGLQAQSVPTSALGTLLVDPTWVVPDVVPTVGTSYSLVIPDDPTLCGVPLYLQAIQLDAGAAAGLSFTAGLVANIGG